MTNPNIPVPFARICIDTARELAGDSAMSLLGDHLPDEQLGVYRRIGQAVAAPWTSGTPAAGAAHLQETVEMHIGESPAAAANLKKLSRELNTAATSESLPVGTRLGAVEGLVFMTGATAEPAQVILDSSNSLTGGPQKSTVSHEHAAVLAPVADLLGVEAEGNTNRAVLEYGRALLGRYYQDAVSGSPAPERSFQPGALWEQLDAATEGLALEADDARVIEADAKAADSVVTENAETRETERFRPGPDLYAHDINGPGWSQLSHLQNRVVEPVSSRQVTLAGRKADKTVLVADLTPYHPTIAALAERVNSDDYLRKIADEKLIMAVKKATQGKSKPFRGERISMSYGRNGTNDDVIRGAFVRIGTHGNEPVFGETARSRVKDSQLIFGRIFGSTLDKAHYEGRRRKR